ncbi:MAG: hypothetical protein ACTSQZ_06080 [Candidatus Thorarchaeota archaeon]
MDSKGTWPFIASLVIGLLYLVVGIISLISGIGIIQSLPFFGDFINAFMIIIVGIVYLTGAKPLMKGDREAFAFAIVGSALAAVLFILQAIVIGTNFLGWILQLNDWIDWNPINDIVPSLWLFVIVLLTIGFLKITNRIGGQKGIFPLGE